MRFLGLVSAALVIPSVALAEPAALQGRRAAVVTPVEAFTPHAEISSTLYLERCVGGCRVTKSNVNDARNMTSSIPQTPGEHTIGEFRSNAGEIGAAADADWAKLMTCMREVWSPFAVTVTDVKPPPTETAHVAIVAGVPQDIGFGSDILGVAPFASNCSPQDNVISFSFANAHAMSDVRTFNLCWTVSQESAHAFGLDHTFKFADGRSACSDPMTYQNDCGGQRFFRNKKAKCGEFTERACRCGETQNSHEALVNVFGDGVSIIPPPTAEVTTPEPGGGFVAVVGAKAGSLRGIHRVELRLNGAYWTEVNGAKFGQNGQTNPSSYGLMVPPNVPDGIIDIQIRACDDLDLCTDSAPVTVTKGIPCESASTCLAHQDCVEGRCMWDPPVGEIGDDCEYTQYCISNLCTGTSDQQICTVRCVPGETVCPAGLTCIETGGDTGVCFYEDTGCCSIGRNGRTPWGYAIGSFVILAILLRRRRASA